MQKCSIDKILSTAADLERQKKIYNTVTLSLLPDKGAKIKNRIDELENLLKELTIEAERPSSPENNIIKSKTKSKDSSNEDSKDSGFSDVSNGASKKTFNIINRDAAERFTSFHDLKKIAGKNDPDPLKEVVHSPSFQTYRNPKPLSRIKLTEAKPVFEDISKKSSKNICFVKHVDSLANEETIKQLHGSLAIFPDNYPVVKQPKILTVTLMPHQIKALSWLMWREDQNPSGGILADDMGLGKTLTMIALIMIQRENNLNEDSKKISDEFTTEGTLIVCLASIVHQWTSEIEKYCKAGRVQVLVHHGAQREKDIRHMRKHDMVITTYQTLMSESKKSSESGLFKLKWERIILDEAHTIKNHKSKTAEAVFSLRGSKKWCVTGTPLHNDFKDLYSLVKFLELHPFDDFKKFKKLTDDKTEDYADRRNMLVKSILLRRTKTQADESGKPLVEMVKKNVTITYIDLSLEERKVYDELNQKVSNLIRRVVDGSSKKFSNSSSLLVLLLRVQQCCCHLSLLNQEPEETVDDSLSENLQNQEGEESVDDILKGLNALDLSNTSSQESNSDSSLNLSFSVYEKLSIYDKSIMSSKLFKLFEELDNIADETKNSDKTVIVSQWVSMLKLVEEHLKKKNKLYHMIVGSTKSEERQTMAEDFNFNSDGCKIMLLSLKAGGVGLNLVGANHLFLLDLHWNPALEMQACDRIHRVGQKKDVFIHKFVCKNTIEEKILDLQNHKSNMAVNALSGAGKVKKGLSLDDLKMLFNL